MKPQSVQELIDDSECFFADTETGCIYVVSDLDTQGFGHPKRIEGIPVFRCTDKTDVQTRYLIDRHRREFRPLTLGEKMEIGKLFQEMHNTLCSIRSPIADLYGSMLFHQT